MTYNLKLHHGFKSYEDQRHEVSQLTALFDTQDSPGTVTYSSYPSPLVLADGNVSHASLAVVLAVCDFSFEP